MSESAAKAIHPVYVDGPLKGRDYPLPGDMFHRVRYADDGTGEGARTDTVYTLQKFGFRSGNGAVVLWLGVSEPGEPDAEVLADLLLSDAAKAARA